MFSFLNVIAVVILVTFNAGLYAAELVKAFDPKTEGLPEAIATDLMGNLYTSMGPANSVIKLNSKGTILERFDLNGVVPDSFSAGLAVAWNRDIFVNVNANSTDARSVWRIQQDGTITKYADIESAAPGFINGMTIDRHDNLYVSDSKTKKIYKIDPAGKASDWFFDAALEGDGAVLGEENPIGANGVALSPSQQHLYVANMDKGTILRIKINRDGSAGSIKEIANDSLLIGTDGINFDRHGKLYGAVNKYNRIVRISVGNGSVTVIEEQGENLDFPTDLVFGKGRNSFTLLYIANASLLTGASPALLKIKEGELLRHSKRSQEED